MSIVILGKWIIEHKHHIKKSSDNTPFWATCRDVCPYD